MPIALCDVKDGALSARPLLQLPVSPSANAAAWPLQLQFLETADSHLRRVLGSASQPARYRDYLRTWIDQVDTTPNADGPPTLRGVSMKQFESTGLVSTKFDDPCPIDRLDPPTFPAAQVTTHNPTKITHILKSWAIRHLARKLKPIIAVMKLQKDGKPVPESLTAQCSTIVIGQDGFVDAARAAAFPRFGTRDVSSPTVVVARPGQFMSFATSTPIPVLGGTRAGRARGGRKTVMTRAKQ